VTKEVCSDNKNDNKNDNINMIKYQEKFEKYEKDIYIKF